MSAKGRLSVSVDTDVLAAAEREVKLGDAPTLSAWVNDALKAKLASSRRRRALDEFIKEYEAEFGEITEKDMENARREAKRRAIQVRGLRAGEVRKPYRR